MTSNNSDFINTDFTNTMSTVMKMADLFLPPRENSIPYDLLESDKEIRIYVEFPGITPNNVSIDFFNNELKIAGKKIPYVLENSGEKLEESKNNFVTLRKTIKQNDNNLKITLPLAVTDQKNVKVSLKNGILSIFIDKEAENKNSFSVKIDEN